MDNNQVAPVTVTAAPHGDVALNLTGVELEFIKELVVTALEGGCPKDVAADLFAILQKIESAEGTK